MLWIQGTLFHEFHRYSPPIVITHKSGGERVPHMRKWFSPRIWGYFLRIRAPKRSTRAIEWERMGRGRGRVRSNKFFTYTFFRTLNSNTITFGLPRILILSSTWIRDSEGGGRPSVEFSIEFLFHSSTCLFCTFIIISLLRFCYHLPLDGIRMISNSISRSKWQQNEFRFLKIALPFNNI